MAPNHLTRLTHFLSVKHIVISKVFPVGCTSLGSDEARVAEVHQEPTTKRQDNYQREQCTAAKVMREKMDLVDAPYVYENGRSSGSR